VNGAGKTTQLQIITGTLQPDSGSVLKEKANMRIAYLTQEFDVVPTRTVRVRDVPLISLVVLSHLFKLVHSRELFHRIGWHRKGKGF
jgi:ABC-type Mn2+/Zn2+ transport system ATPase subunit